MPYSLPSHLSTLLSRPQPPPLCPQHPWDASLAPHIDALPHAPPSLRSALHLLNDDLHTAHTVAQADEGVSTSDLVHAVLHRRERDFWNSKWWLARISHPLLTRVHGGPRQAAAFVDQCEATVGGRSSACGAQELERLKAKQWEELHAIVQYALDEA